ncbi:hypothetical protein J6A31_00980 [bacterium]|nr:hypothetical protein [bacterium]
MSSNVEKIKNAYDNSIKAANEKLDAYMPAVRNFVRSNSAIGRVFNIKSDIELREELFDTQDKLAESEARVRELEEENAELRKKLSITLGTSVPSDTHQMTSEELSEYRAAQALSFIDFGDDGTEIDFLMDNRPGHEVASMLGANREDARDVIDYGTSSKEKELSK